MSTIFEFVYNVVMEYGVSRETVLRDMGIDENLSDEAIEALFI